MINRLIEWLRAMLRWLRAKGPPNRERFYGFHDHQGKIRFDDDLSRVEKSLFSDSRVLLAETESIHIRTASFKQSQVSITRLSYMDEMTEKDYQELDNFSSFNG
jgi:hypothetical protein